MRSFSIRGTSFIEILIALTIFSTVAFGSAIASLNSLRMTNLALNITRNLIESSSSK